MIDRLDEAIKARELKAEKQRLDSRQQERETENKECTFRPKINSTSHVACRRRSVEDMLGWKKQATNRLVQRKVEDSINGQSRQVRAQSSGNRSASQSIDGSIIRLYGQAVTKALKQKLEDDKYKQN